MFHSLLALVFLAILGVSQQTKYPKGSENFNSPTGTKENSLHPTKNGFCTCSSLGKSAVRTACARAERTKEPSEDDLSTSDVSQREDPTKPSVKSRNKLVLKMTPRTLVNQSSQRSEQNFQLTPKPPLNPSKQDGGCTGLILLESDKEVLPQETNALALKLSKPGNTNVKYDHFTIVYHSDSNLIVFKPFGEPDAFQDVIQWLSKSEGKKFPFIGFKKFHLNDKNIVELEDCFQKSYTLTKVFFYQVEFINEAIFHFTFKNYLGMETIVFKECEISIEGIKRFRHLAEFYGIKLYFVQCTAK